MENKNKIYDPRGAGRFLSLQDKKKHMKVGSRDRPIKGNGQGRLSARERSPERSPSVPAKRATRITPRAPSSTARKREPSSRVRGHSSERLWLKFDIARRWPATLGAQAVNNKSKAKDYIRLTPEVHSTFVREWSKVYTPMTPGSDITPSQVGGARTSKHIYPLGLHSYRGLRRKRRRSALSSWGHPHNMGRNGGGPKGGTLHYPPANSRFEGIALTPLLSRQRGTPSLDTLRGRSRRSETLWATSKMDTLPPLSVHSIGGQGWTSTIQEELGGNERDAMVKLSGGNYKLFLSRHKVINKIIKDNLKLLEISKFTHVVAKRHDRIMEPSSGRMQWASVNFWITTTWLAIGELFSQIKKVRKNRGMYLQISGRLGRAKMARKKRFKKIWGVVNNASVTTKGEFSSQQIHTKLGVIGLKVYSC